MKKKNIFFGIDIQMIASEYNYLQKASYVPSSYLNIKICDQTFNRVVVSQSLCKYLQKNQLSFESCCPIAIGSSTFSLSKEAVKKVAFLGSQVNYRFNSILCNMQCLLVLLERRPVNTCCNWSLLSQSSKNKIKTHERSLESFMQLYHYGKEHYLGCIGY